MDYGKKIEEELPRLRRFARSLTKDAVTADDLVQGCIVQALSKTHLFQPDTNFRAWLFTIMHNQFVNELRKGMRRGVPVQINDNTSIVPPTQGSGLIIRDLDRALAKLPEEHRTVILLTGVDGLSYEAIAKIMGINAGTVASRLSRGRDYLRILMGEKQKTAEAIPLPKQPTAYDEFMATVPKNLLWWRWPRTGLPTCPNCGGANRIRLNTRTEKKSSFICNVCATQFTLTGKTIFDRSHLSYKQMGMFLDMTRLCPNKLTVVQIMTELECSLPIAKTTLSRWNTEYRIYNTAQKTIGAK